MEIDRRRLMTLFGGLLVAPANVLAAPDSEPLFLAARTEAGRHTIAVFDSRGSELFSIPVDARGHSFAIDARNRMAVAFDRAPGTHAVLFDVDNRKDPLPLVAAPGRHFFGHGIFSSDGKLLLASENDYGEGRGVLGVYDVAAGCRRIGEFASGGVGPHDLVLMPDGRTLCVANGGILTHPDYDGIKLNLDEMTPSLAYVDLHSGELVEEVRLAPELHRLSIRHLVVDAFGVVWFGCQYEGEAADRPPLVGRHRRGEEPVLFAGPVETLRALDNYVGSVAVDLSGEIVATSSPLGGLITYWDAATGRNLGQTPLADGCGVAPLQDGGILATSGRGTIAAVDVANSRLRSVAEQPAVGWDNHLRRIG
ncbi:MAG: DUF1513 domain-containing protein [Neoaquamicrobium sediminum]